MKAKTWEALTEYLDVVDQALAKMQEDIAGLREAVKQSGIAYCGVWRGSEEYRRGSVVTDRGTLWHCDADGTKDRPGTSDAWTLMVKSPR